MQLNTKIYVSEGLNIALKKAAEDLKNCGALSSEKSDQSTKNKEYFSSLAEEAKITIKEISEILNGVLSAV